MSESRPHLDVASVAEWGRWLQENHAVSTGVWLIRWRQGTDGPQLAYEEVICEALAWGWVDSQVKKVDESRSRLLFTPRKPRSVWSAPNKQRIERLLAEGRMRPPGLAVVEAAKESGAWTALDSAEALEEPEDLARVLDSHSGARGHWDAFPPSTRKAILQWIAAAKRPPTREARVRQTAELAAQNIRANQWRQPKGR